MHAASQNLYHVEYSLPSPCNYNNAASRAMTHNTDLAFSNTAWFTTAMNGSLSALSSILIMSIIFRSSTEARSSAYHIIMFFMSFWDAIVSFAMALNTFPMPQDVYDVYPFAGKAFGTVGTCELQGFFILLGTFFVLGSNTVLNFYYVCTFRFGMAEEKFKRKVMSVMFGCYLIIAIVFSQYVLKMDLINPSPHGNVCSGIKYPEGCNNYDADADASNHLDFHHDHDDRKMTGLGEGVVLHVPVVKGGTTSTTKCIRGRNDPMLSLLLYIFVGGAFVLLVLSLTLVVATVFEAELRIRKSRRALHTSVRPVGVDTTTHHAHEPTRNHMRAATETEDFERTRAVLIQALMYISAFVLTFIWLPIMLARARNTTNGVVPSNTLIFCKLFFRPLQGFFNAMIFMYQKVHTLRRTNRALTISGALRQVVISPSVVPQVVVSMTGIDMEDGGTRRHHGQNLRRYPVRLATTEMQEVAHNSGMRRLGYDNNNTPNSRAISSSSPSSSSSSMGSSISLDEHFDSVHEDNDENNSSGGVSSDDPQHLKSSVQSGTTPHPPQSNDINDDANPSFSMESTIDSVL